MERFIICPHCKEFIPDGALKCPICKSWLTPNENRYDIYPLKNRTNKRKSFFNRYFWEENVKRLFAYSKTCTAKEFWLGNLALIIISVLPISICLFIIGGNIGRPKDLSLAVIYIWSLYLLLCGLSLGLRRLNGIGRSKWWFLLNLLPVIGNIILAIWFSKRSTYVSAGSKFKIWDWLIILSIFTFWLGSEIMYGERMAHIEYNSRSIRVREQRESTMNNQHLDSNSTNNTTGNKQYARELIDEAKSEYIQYKEFVESAKEAARKKYNQLDANGDYEERIRRRDLKSFSNSNLSSNVINEHLQTASEKYYSNNYDDAVKFAKYALKIIESSKQHIDEILGKYNLSINHSDHSHSTETTNSSNSSGYQPEYGYRDVWIDCMECHGSGKCKYCNGTGKNWYGNEYTDCVVCHGSTNCQICYGTRGHYEKQMYQIK